MGHQDRNKIVIAKKKGGDFFKPFKLLENGMDTMEFRDNMMRYIRLIAVIILLASLIGLGMFFDALGQRFQDPAFESVFFLVFTIGPKHPSQIQPLSGR